MSGVSPLQWLYVAAVFCAFVWMIWKDAGRTWGLIRAGNMGVADIGRGLLASVCAVGLLWFLLWMLTDGLVPHGLYGLGLGAVGVLAGVVGDSIKRKRER